MRFGQIRHISSKGVEMIGQIVVPLMEVLDPSRHKQYGFVVVVWAMISPLPCTTNMH